MECNIKLQCMCTVPCLLFSFLVLRFILTCHICIFSLGLTFWTMTREQIILPEKTEFANE
jgi:hypothetical protein